MSLLSDLVQRVAALTNAINEIRLNSKRNEELPRFNPVDRSALVRGSVGGVSKAFRLQELITEMGVQDGIIQISELSIVPDGSGGEALKIPVVPLVPIWRINNAEYTKTTETLIPIPYATTGMYRTDIIVAGINNDFQRIEGEEGEDVGLPPNIPVNTVEVTRINIFGDQIGDPSAPPINGFITKSSKKYRPRTLESVNDSVLILSDEYTTHLLKLIAGSENVKGFVLMSDDDGDLSVYDGMDVYLKNYAPVPITLLHNDSTAEVPFWFNSEENFVLKENEIYHFKYNKSQNRVELLSGVSTIKKTSDIPTNDGARGVSPYAEMRDLPGTPTLSEVITATPPTDFGTDGQRLVSRNGTASWEDAPIPPEPISNAPEVTEDTLTEITLYQQGNFCNSYTPNLNKNFTYIFDGNESNAGKNATVLIKTEVGDLDFPILADAEFIVGAPFEEDAIYDMFISHNGAVVSYFYTRRENWVQPIRPIDPTLFITTWKTDNPGASDSSSIIIRNKRTTTALVNWDFGNSDIWETVTGIDFNHTYDSPGIYTVAIDSPINNVYLGSSPDRKKILSIEQWGTILIYSADNMFFGCLNLVSNATDKPIFGSQLWLLDTLAHTLFNSPVDDWDMTGVTQISGIFRDSPFDQNMGNWNIGSVTRLNNLCRDLSTANYDATLIGWAAQTVKPNVVFGVGSTKYTLGGAAEAARNILTSAPNNWIITDGGGI